MRTVPALILVIMLAACGAGNRDGSDDAFPGDLDALTDGVGDAARDAVDVTTDSMEDMPEASLDPGADSLDAVADAAMDIGVDAAGSRVRSVRVLDFAGIPVAGASVLRHDAAARLLQQVMTDNDGWAEVAWNDGDMLSAPIHFQPGSILNWVTVVGFDAPGQLVIGKPGWGRNEVGRNLITVGNLEPDEYVAVHTPCDATTLWDERPSAEFRWYDSCVSGDNAMVIATTHHRGVPDVLLRSSVVEAKVGSDLVIDDWQAPAVVAFTLPPEVDAVEELAIEIKDRGFGVRRFLASPGRSDLQATLVGLWQLQFWGYRGDSQVFVMKNLLPGPSFQIESDDMLPIQPVTVTQQDGLVHLARSSSDGSDLRSTLLVMGDPCTDVGYYHNVISDGRLRDLTVPFLGDPGTTLVLTAHSELAVRYPGLAPALAIHTLGAPSIYPSPDLSAIHAAAGPESPDMLSAYYTIHGRISCH